MKNFRAKDYIYYNNRLGLYGYKYLHKILDLLYLLKEKYNIIDDRLIYYEDEDTGRQAEVKGTCYYDVSIRILLNKRIFKELWEKRHKH